MTDHGQHCPFLNRTDSRCAKNLSLDALGYAFDYCFGFYEGCAMYQELLSERRVRRAMGRAQFISPGAEEIADDNPRRGNFVQLTVAGRDLQRAADPQVASHAPGL